VTTSSDDGRSGVIPAVALLLLLAISVVHAIDVQELRSVGGLAPHLAGAFEEIVGCHFTADGRYLVFDRRDHAISIVSPRAAAPTKIVQIGQEKGRLFQPVAFDSSPDGTFVVADAPGGRPRIQFFVHSGSPLGGFTMSGRDRPQLRVGDMVLSGVSSIQYTGKSLLLSQPDTGALVTEYALDGATVRTFGDLRPTGHEQDTDVHHALNAGLPLVNPKGGYYFVFLAGTPMFRKYDASGVLVFERHIEGVEVDPFLRTLPTAWARRPGAGRDEFPLVPASIRAAAVDADGQLWISLAVPFTYVYDSAGDKRRIIQFRGAGIISPTNLFFTHDKRLLVTPGCYAFPVGAA
jgi:hypothetical protein